MNVEVLEGHPQMSRTKRVLYCGLGILFIGIAIVGVALPGIPTTGPLIAASFFLTKTNPRLEKKLLGLKIFRRYRHYLDGSTAMPLRARLWALGWMWGSIATSCYFLSHAEHASSAMIGGTLVMGCIGTAVITLCRRATAVAPTAQYPQPSAVATVDQPEEQLLIAARAIQESLDPVSPDTQSSRSSTSPLPTTTYEQRYLRCAL